MPWKEHHDLHLERELLLNRVDSRSLDCYLLFHLSLRYLSIRWLAGQALAYLRYHEWLRRWRWMGLLLFFFARVLVILS